MCIVSVCLAWKAEDGWRARDTLSIGTHLLDEIVHVSGVVGLLPQHVCAGRDLLHKNVALLTLAYLNAFLDHVVPISVLHHGVKGPVQLLASAMRRAYFFVQVMV